MLRLRFLQILVLFHPHQQLQQQESGKICGEGVDVEFAGGVQMHKAGLTSTRATPP